MSTYRYDPLENEWVIISPHRLKKPTLEAQDVRMVSEKCPFCEGNEALSDGEIDATASDPNRTRNTAGWINRVVANRYKAVSIESCDEVSERSGMFLSRGGFGAHEIVVDTPRHDADLAGMQTDEVIVYLQMIRRRLEDLARDRKIAYISVFKNVGVLAGETLAHPHTQIVALPFVPPHIEAMVRRENDYHWEHQSHLLLDDVARSIEEGERIVSCEGEFCLYAPFASRYPFELRIVPRSVIRSLRETSSAQMISLAVLLRRSIKLVKRVLGEKTAYNVVLREVPCASFNDRHIFHVMIIPRLFGTTALQSEERVPINPMSPEEAARLYKERL